ncbi:MAG: M23 family metallopeptidase [Salinivirgaceae bacterium]|nr:M23 family metallopeptidase [Salinivirgaceae bacterium]
MSKVRFSFDSDKLSYDKITLSAGQKIFRFLRRTFVVLIFAVLMLYGLSLIFETSGEKIQKRENKQLVFQYELLNKKVEGMERSINDIQQHDDNIYRMIFGIEPNSEPEVKTLSYNDLKRYSNSELIAMASHKLDTVLMRVDSKADVYDNVINESQKRTKFLAAVPAVFPVDNTHSIARVASGYGYRIHPIYQTLKMHTGIDIAAPAGTSVYATGNGRVASVENHPTTRGRVIVIDHGYGYKTVYEHLGKAKVRTGQRVTRGDVIGEVGSTGRSTAPHLHYEVHKRNKTENPINYYYADLSPEQYDNLIKASSLTTMSFD